MRNLCDKAPRAARLLATTILEYSDINNSPRDGIDDPQPKSAGLDNNSIQPMKRKTASHKDLSYRPPKPAKAKGEETDSLDKAGQPESGSSHIDRLAEQVPPKPGDVSDENLPADLGEGGLAEDGKVELHPGKSIDHKDMSGTAGEKKAIRASRTTSLSDEDGERHSASRESAAKAMSMKPASPDTAVPATPAKQVEDVLPSPQTEEIHRGKIPRSLESTSSSPSPPMSSPSIEVTSLGDMILEAVRVIHGFSKYQHGVPREVHSRILQTLREDDKENFSVPNLDEWSDGSMWMRVLEAGGSENQKVTIFNMLEYMGAWKWYDRQVKLSQATVRTKKNKPVDRRGAAIHVLNRMQGLQTRTEQPGKWIGGVGRLTLGKEGDEAGTSPESCDASIAERARHSQRKCISMQLSRGHKLSTKLVKELGLGILFSPKIW